MSNTNKKVFISYTSADSKFAKKLATNLFESGIPIWWDEWEIEPGDNIAEKINDGIQEAGFFIVILTPESTSREWVKKEWTSAFTRACDDKDLVIIPILKKNCDLPSVLKTLRYIDFRNKFKKPSLELKNYLLKKMNIDPSEENLEDTWVSRYEKGNLNTKISAIEILLKIGTARSMGALLEDIELQDEKVQKKIMKKLKHYISPILLPNLRRLAHTDNPILAPQACAYLLGLGDTSKFHILLELAKSEDIKQRVHALKSIPLYKNYSYEDLRQIINILKNSLAHPDSSIRLSALDLVARLSPQLNQYEKFLVQVRYFVMHLLEARDIEVRKMADNVFSYLQK